MKNTLLLDALKGTAKSAPIWFMRQAGRYMPQYRALRAEHSLKELFCSPKMAAKITLMPIELLGVDAAIVFSDILAVCDLLGLGWDFCEGRGPCVERIEQDRAIRQLPVFPFEKASYLADVIGRVKQSCDVPLIGFCGGPLTVASYLVAGGSDADLKQTKLWMKESPQAFLELLQKVTDATVIWARGQIECGIDVIQVFDTWCGLLPEEDLIRFVLPFHRQLLSALPPSFPKIFFSRQSQLHFSHFLHLGYTAYSVDFDFPLRQAREMTNKPLQGNLHPLSLMETQPQIQRCIDDIADQMAGDQSFIFNLGHGVLPKTPFENVRFAVQHWFNRRQNGRYARQGIPSVDPGHELSSAALHQLPDSARL